MKGIEVITDDKGVRKLKVAFSLWPVEQKSEKGPSATGTDKATGVRAAAWTREWQGKKYMSGSVEIPLSVIPGGESQPEAPNDDIPF